MMTRRLIITRSDIQFIMVSRGERPQDFEAYEGSRAATSFPDILTRISKCTNNEVRADCKTPTKQTMLPFLFDAFEDERRWNGIRSTRNGL